MTIERIISLSAAPYDGHSVPEMLDSIRSVGGTHIEPAFIVGYTEPFDESIFSAANSAQWRRWLSNAEIGCHAFSAHMDLGDSKSITIFRKRMDFARALGARIINTNAAARLKHAQFMKNIHALAKHGEDIGLCIGLENPGDGSDNVLNTAADAQALLSDIGHPYVMLNHDAGNAISHQSGLDTVSDALLALPLCAHVHLKDVSVRSDGYYFCHLGQGDVGCERILVALAETPLNVSIEIPLRLHRRLDGSPVRSAQPESLETIESYIGPALEYVSRFFN